MKLRELIERIEIGELNVLEVELDKLFKKYKIDIGFTYHFKQRMNDLRNKKPITIDELRKIFISTHKKYGRRIAGNETSFEAVLKDLSSNINIPFALQNKKGPKNDLRDLKAKTIMRKRNFGTPDHVFKV